MDEWVRGPKGPEIFFIRFGSGGKYSGPEYSGIKRCAKTGISRITGTSGINLAENLTFLRKLIIWNPDLNKIGSNFLVEGY